MTLLYCNASRFTWRAKQRPWADYSPPSCAPFLHTSMQHGDNLILLSVFYSGTWNFNYLPRFPYLFHPMNDISRSGTTAPSVCSLRASTFSLPRYDGNRGESREKLGPMTVSPFNNSLTTSLTVRNNRGIQRLLYRTIYTTTK
jgi:hypothetical protein